VEPGALALPLEAAANRRSIPSICAVVTKYKRAQIFQLCGRSGGLETGKCLNNILCRRFPWCFAVFFSLFVSGERTEKTEQKRLAREYVVGEFTSFQQRPPKLQSLCCFLNTQISYTVRAPAPPPPPPPHTHTHFILESLPDPPWCLWPRFLF